MKSCATSRPGCWTRVLLAVAGVFALGLPLGISQAADPAALRVVTDANFNANAVGPIGGSQPHDNMMPYLVITFIISLFGVFPSQ